jgi:FtsZ-binding cell division protein ZapB
MKKAQQLYNEQPELQTGGDRLLAYAEQLESERDHYKAERDALAAALRTMLMHFEDEHPGEHFNYVETISALLAKMEGTP